MASLIEVLHPLVGYKMHVHVQFSQSTSKLAFQNIMNYLRLLLFFFAMLAPLQLTSAGVDWRCYISCLHAVSPPTFAILRFCSRKCNI